MITTNDPEVARQCRIIRNHGMDGRDDHVRLGFNNRMTEMEAAMGLVQLKKLDALNEKRIRNSEYILERAKDLPWAHAPLPGPDVRHTYFWCPLMVKEDSGRTIGELMKHLRAHQIGFRHRYKEPLYRQPALARQGLDYSGIYLPNVEKVVGRIVGLPNHAGLTRDELDKVIDVLYRF